MKFLSIRELRSSTSHLKEMLSGNDKVVLTTNGKPTALMIGVDENSFEDLLNDLRSARVRRSIKQMREHSEGMSLDEMTLDDINAEISAVRSAQA
jgi:antitoxin (DNA-binding transcriptional repressor) of toxin-antitoxin stability system